MSRPFVGRAFFSLQRYIAKAEMERVRVIFGPESRRLVRAEPEETRKYTPELSGERPLGISLDPVTNQCAVNGIK